MGWESGISKDHLLNLHGNQFSDSKLYKDVELKKNFNPHLCNQTKLQPYPNFQNSKTFTIKEKYKLYLPIYIYIWNEQQIKKILGEQYR